MYEKDRQSIGLICKPDHKARFVVHEAGLPICPEPLMPWYPNDTGQLDIRDCYNGEDCWMGPYNGASAHCGLDINMPAGTAYATTAGVRVGRHEHTHFNFRVIEQGGDYMLDPWIIFWETFRPQREGFVSENGRGFGQ